MSFSRCKEKLTLVFKKVEAGISEKNTQIEEDDKPMADWEGHMHCFIFSGMEDGGDQADGQAGHAGEEEVEAQGSVHFLFAWFWCRGKEREEEVGNSFQNVFHWRAQKTDRFDDADIDPSCDDQDCIESVGAALRADLEVGSRGNEEKNLAHPHKELAQRQGRVYAMFSFWDKVSFTGGGMEPRETRIGAVFAV